MTLEQYTWQKIHDHYIHLVKKALSAVKHPRQQEILEDVRAHLERKYNELEDSQRNWEGFQNIITEMGPASDFAELLVSQSLSHEKPRGKNILVVSIMGLCLVIVFLGVLLSWTAGKKEDNEYRVDYKFKNDPAVLGAWKVIGMVNVINQFRPDHPQGREHSPYNHLIFDPDGIIPGDIFHWTKGKVINPHMQRTMAYILKTIQGNDYLFLETIMDDHNTRRLPPRYIVFERTSRESVHLKAMMGETADIPPSSTFNEQGHIEDKVDYPFVDDPYVIGTWKSVDFVQNIEEFNTNKKQWEHGPLFLMELTFKKNGELVAKNKNVPTGYLRTWTKGLVLSKGREKTASRYIIKKINGSDYMFYEWKSGDYYIRYRKPSYYVLKKQEIQLVSDPTQEAMAIAIKKATPWLDLVDENRYQESWQESASYFKTKVTQTHWQTLMIQHRKMLGKTISRDIIHQQFERSLPGVPDGQYVIVQYRTVFENKKSSIETVTLMLDADGQWRVSGYYIK